MCHLMPDAGVKLNAQAGGLKLNPSMITMLTQQLRPAKERIRC